MDRQIEAENIRQVKLDDDEWICIAGVISGDKEIHVYNIGKLIKLIGYESQVMESPFSKIQKELSFMYNGYKFFGLIDKRGDENEGSGN